MLLSYFCHQTYDNQMPHVQNQFIYKYWASISICMPLMNSLQSTLWQGTLVYTHLTLRHMPLNKYSCNIQKYISLYCFCSVPIDPTVVHTSVNNKDIAIFPQFIAIYVPTTNMLLKCHIHALCPNCSMCNHDGGMPMHMLHRNVLASMMWPETLYTGKQNDFDDTAFLTVKTSNGQRPNQLKRYSCTI